MYKLINYQGLSFSRKLLKWSIWKKGYIWKDFGLKRGMKISYLGWHTPVLFSLNYNIYKLLDDA
jgi:hypothetical protein